MASLPWAGPMNFAPREGIPWSIVVLIPVTKSIGFTRPRMWSAQTWRGTREANLARWSKALAEVDGLKGLGAPGEMGQIREPETCDGSVLHVEQLSTLE